MAKQESKKDTALITKINTVGKLDNRLISSDFAELSKDWSNLDLDLFHLVTSQSVNKNDTEIRLSANEVKQFLLAHRKHQESLNTFIEHANDSLRKFVGMTVTYKTTNKDGKLALVNTHLFSVSYIDADLCIRLRVERKSLNIFNNLRHWTRYALDQFVRLHTNYAKRLFIYCKKWRTVGRFEMTVDDFKKALDVPKSYEPYNITQRVIKPCLEELSPFFRLLKIVRVYGKGKRGRKLKKYVITFAPEAKNHKDVGIDSRLADVRAVYYIMSNPYLPLKSRFRAIDKYRGLRLNSTEKLYKKTHPQTYFVGINAPKTGTKDAKLGLKLHQYDWSMLKKQSTKTLVMLAKTYEKLLKHGKLKEWDFDDLAGIETLLYAKNCNNKDLLVSKLDKDIFKDDLSKANRQLQTLIKQDFGSFIKAQDHRPQEIKGTFA